MQCNRFRRTRWRLVQEGEDRVACRHLRAARATNPSDPSVPKSHDCAMGAVSCGYVCTFVYTCTKISQPRGRPPLLRALHSRLPSSSGTDMLFHQRRAHSPAPGHPSRSVVHGWTVGARRKHAHQRRNHITLGTPQRRTFSRGSAVRRGHYSHPFLGVRGYLPELSATHSSPSCFPSVSSQRVDECTKGLVLRLPSNGGARSARVDDLADATIQSRECR